MGSSSTSLNRRTPSTLGRVGERHRIMAANVALASTGVIACDRRKGRAGARRSAPGVQGSPQRSRHCPQETAREELTRGGKVRVHPFGAGLRSQPVAAEGDRRIVRRNGTPEGLDDWPSRCYHQALYRSGLYDLPETSQKISGCYARSNPNIHSWAPSTGE